MTSRIGQALLVELGGVEPDADVPLQGAHEGDLADAGDRLELFFEPVADVVAEDALGVRPAEPDHHDGLVLGVGLGDDGRIHVAGQAPGGLGDLGLDVLEGQVDVPGELDLDRDVGRALSRARGDRPDPLDLDEGFLEGLDDLVLDDLRGRSLPRGGDVDRGKIDVGELADADPAAGHDAENDRGGHEHPGQDGLSDAGFCQVHRAYPFFAGGACLSAGFSAEAWRRARSDHPNRHPVLKGLGAPDDQDLADLEAGKDLDLSIGRPHAQGQNALDGLVPFDDEGDEAAFARPDGRNRDDGGFAGGAHGHRDLGEGPGPERPVARIVDVGGDVDQPRNVVGGLGHVDDLGRELAAVIPDAEAGFLAGLDPRGVAFGDLEPQEERVAPDERRQDRPRLDILAGLDRPRLDDARDGRPDEGVAEVELGLVEGRPLLGDIGSGGQDFRPPGFDFLAGDEAGRLGDDGLAALEAGFGVGLGRLGLLVRGLGRLDGQAYSALSRSRRGPGWRRRILLR